MEIMRDLAVQKIEPSDAIDVYAYALQFWYLEGIWTLLKTTTSSLSIADLSDL